MSLDVEALSAPEAKSSLRRNRFARAVVSSASSGMGTLFLRLLSIALLSRLVEADSFGFYFLGQSIALVCSVAGNLSSSYRIMEAASLGRGQFAICLAIPVLLTALLLTVLGMVAESAMPGYPLALLGATGVAVAASAPLMSALRTAEALSRRHFRFRHLAWAEIWATLAGFFVCAPALALAGYSGLALAAGHWTYVLAKLALVLAQNARALPSALPRGDAAPSASGRLSAYGLEVLDLASVHLLRLVVGAAFGQTVVALWSRGAQLILLAVNLLVQPISYVLVPLGLRDRDRREHLADHAPEVIDSLSLLLLPVSISVFVLSEEIAAILLGQSWTDTAPYLRAFSLLMLGRTVQRAFGILGRATQTSAVRLGIDGASLAGYLVVAAALVQGGPLLAAWVFSVTSCLAAIFHFRQGSFHKRRWPWRFIGALGIYALVCAAFVQARGPVSPLEWKIAFLVIIWMMIGSVYGLAAWLKKPLLKQETLEQFLQQMDHHTIR